MTLVSKQLRHSNLKLTECLLDHIEINNSYNYAEFMPFIHPNGGQIGWISKKLILRLKQFKNIFVFSDTAIHFDDRLNSFDSITAALDEVSLTLRDEGIFEQFRSEFYGVAHHFDQPALFKVRRGAASYFGFKAYGVHMNGLVIKDGEIQMWITTRSKQKQVAAGKLDHLVGGGLPYGIAVIDNLAKEAFEEAGIPAKLIKNAMPVSSVSYCRQTDIKLRRDTIFIYDCVLPNDFQPTAQDGEVAEFFLWPIEQVIENLMEVDNFKFNCTLVLIDFLLRNGYITPDDRHYIELINGLHSSKGWV
jgi:8-oxo-dGTP pyrophosphatase MutT (NUDIX family)